MSIPKLRKQDDGLYYIYWSDGRRSKRISTKLREESIALIVFAYWLLERAEPSLIDSVKHRIRPRNFEPSIASLWQAYWDRHIEKSAIGRETAGYAWKNLRKHFGSSPFTEIDQAAVDDYSEKRMQGTIGRPAKSATIRRELSYLAACLNWCSSPRIRIIDGSKIIRFESPPDGEPKDRWLTESEIKLLFSAASEMRRGPRLSRGERFLHLALATGARKQAIIDLTWDRVDFETRVVHYNVPGRRKTKKRRVSVPISDALLPVLKRAYDERISDRVLDNGADVDAIVNRIAARANLGNVGPNVLRHTAATWMARRGVPLWIIAGILGNSVQMIERVYAKHSPDALVQGTDAISDIIPPAS